MKLRITKRDDMHFIEVDCNYSFSYILSIMHKLDTPKNFASARTHTHTHKMTFRDHVNYVEEKCTKLIFTLSKSAKVTWGLKHTALKTIYAGGILPLILYGAPVWKGVLDITCYNAKLIRVQRLINIRIAKAYRTVSNEALCVITGLIPINIKIDETAKYYESVKGQGNLFDREMEVKHWTHPANTVEITDGQEDGNHNKHVYTDGSKSEQRVGSRIAIFKDSKLIDEKIQIKRAMFE